MVGAGVGAPVGGATGGVARADLCPPATATYSSVVTEQQPSTAAARSSGSAVDRCPECGAPNPPGASCFEMFGVLLAREAEDPELLAEHFFTVACYNLQHPAQFTDDAIAELRQAVIDRLDHGTPVAVLRKRASAAYEGSRRVLRRPGERRVVARRWPMTIADVCTMEDLSGAAGRVKQWAASIRSQL
jgi:hypothetical protein